MALYVAFLSSAGLLVAAFLGMILLSGGWEAGAAGVAIIAGVLLAVSLAALAVEADRPGPRGQGHGLPEHAGAVTPGHAMLESAVRVLVVEDEVDLASLIRKGLREEGLLADVAIKGEDALWMAGATPYDAIVLDVMLPGIDGFETCRRLRADGVKTPILMLTARDAVEDRIEGLDTGADDYLPKPFDFGELLARLRALARRGPTERDTVLRVGDLELDPATQRVRRGEREIPLSTKEFQLLEVFMRHPGEVLSRYRLLEGAWDTDYEHRSNVIDVYVRYLRAKVDRPFGVETIETVRGAGYRLRPE